MKTYLPSEKELERKWYLVDANDQVLGRLASHLAVVLMGKHRPCYTSFFDTGEYLVVVNAAKIKLTGNKWEAKTYYSHTGYPGGLKSTTAEEMRARHPDRLIRLAVKGMLPKNRLANRMLKKLKVYAGDDHPHQAQQPEPLEF